MFSRNFVLIESVGVSIWLIGFIVNSFNKDIGLIIQIASVIYLFSYAAYWHNKTRKMSKKLFGEKTN
jgi:hypothetical protein